MLVIEKCPCFGKYIPESVGVTEFQGFSLLSGGQGKANGGREGEGLEREREKQRM